MSFYNPYRKGPDIGQGMTDMFQQVMQAMMMKKMFENKPKQTQQQVPTELPPGRGMMGMQRPPGPQMGPQMPFPQGPPQGMPQGMPQGGGGGGIASMLQGLTPEMIQQLMQNPQVAQLLQNPEMLQMILGGG